MKRFLTLIAIIVLLSITIVRSQTINPLARDGEIYVKFKNEYPLKVSQEKFGNININEIPCLSSLITKYGIKKVYKSFYFSKDYVLLQTVRVKFEKKEKVMDLIRELHAIPSIEYAEPVPYLKHCLTPNDMGANSVANGTWHLYKINAQQAWDISTGSTSIKVAVVDNAVQTAHPDLAANMLAGYDVADNDNDPNPPSTDYDHGTHVAGIASGVSNNGVGIASIGYTVKIIPVKSTNDVNSITDGYEGVTWAANNGADVINMSWGGEGSSTTAQNVINSAYNLGCVLIAAAGNSGDDGNPIFYPAAYTNCIAVANTTSTDAKATSSQYGTWVDVAAPGTNIRSCIPTSTYAIFSGTSMASPLVAGLCGLMLSVNPSLTQTQVRNCLLNSVDNIDAVNPSYIGQIGTGRINAYQALVCVNATVNALDAGVSTIISPASTLCAASYTPIVKLKNFGSTTLTSTAIKYRVDSGTLLNYNWNGSLASNSEVNITLPGLTATQGPHTFKAYTTAPNAGTDQNNANDTTTVNFYYYSNGLTLPFAENFESNSFTTNNWTITNPDNSITWGIETTAGETPGDKSAKMDFYNYSTTGQRDGLQTPPLNFVGYSSVSLSFHHAYRRYDQTATDSLIVFVSTDCGTSFPNIVLAKGENGQGVFATTNTSTTEFIPTIDTVWCFAGTIGSTCYTVDLSAYIGNPRVIVKFEGYNNYQNNLYLDNINITGVQANTPPTPNFSANKTNICKGDTVVYTDLSTPSATTWTWTFPGGTPSSSNVQNPTVIYNTAGNYNVTLLAGNTAGSNTLTNTNYITVNALPSVPTITQNGNLLSTSATNVTYQWFINGTIIPNATASSITASVSGAYTVQVTNTSGCKSVSAAFNFVGSNPYDAGITAVTNPSGTSCSGSIVPVVTIKNFGLQTLTSAVIKYQIDNGTLNSFNWTGTLTTNNTANVTLTAVSTTAGAHVFTVYTALPNGYSDTYTANDTAVSNFSVAATGASLPFTEDFQSGLFTTNNWTILNPDNGRTWDILTTNCTFVGNNAARMRFFGYTATGQRDAMVSTPLNFNGYSAVQLDFEHAYKRKNTSGTDSLIIYVSTDCGVTFPNRVFARGQSTSTPFATGYTSATEFTPASSDDWCMGSIGADCFSVDLTSFAGNPSVIIKFESYNGNQNNLFIDNINITGTPVTIAPVANFAADATTIGVGGSVNFTDLSTNTPTSWSWTFAGGTPGTSTVQNPSNIVYNTPGTYNVTLIATNANGNDTELKTAYITVVGVAPVANFSANNTTINTGSSVNFTDLSTNTPTSWSWTFAGGTPGTSTVQNPTNIVYNTPGTYNVTLIATNAYGNDTELKTGYIIVNTTGIAPVANFSANNTTINTGGSVNFTDLSINTPTSWSWTFAGGTPGTSTVQNPTNIVYNTPGTYNVTLIATNAYGNDTELKTGYIIVNATGVAPVANFSANNTTINVGGNVNFTDLSTNTPTSWSWTFAGGTPGTSTVQNPSNIVYNTPGTYNVTLIATNAYGNDTELKTGYIIVNATGIAPVANFSANNTTINSGGSVNFTDLSANTPTSWSWTFTGGTPGTSTVQNPSNIVYNTPGTYNVRLIATNAYGNDTELKTAYITVNASGNIPVANFIANNTTINTGASVNFSDLSLNSPTSWSWTFAGGTPATSTVQNPTNIVYNTSGSYNVTLIATNTSGSDTEIKTGYIIVNTTGTVPVANFIANNTAVNEGGSVNFIDLSTNIPTSWSWTFAGGTPATSTAQNPTNIVYNTSGSYDVTLIATNASGNDTEIKTGYIIVNAAGTAPIANFIADNTSINTGGSVNFTDLSANTPTSWSWTFAGGTPATSSVQNPSNIVYSSPGTYDVTLIATNAFGYDIETKTGYITVSTTGYAPEADFVANITTVSAGSSVNFSDLSTNNPSSWNWTFAGGSPSSSSFQNPMNIIYNTPGIYDVTLNVINAYGNDTEIKAGYIIVNAVTSAPVVDFSADYTSITEGDVINFTDLSTNTPTTWLWAFEGGTPSSSTIQHPVNIQYNTQGTYYVTLIATNTFGSGFLNKDLYITVLPASGIENSLNINNVFVYPNPAHNILNIEFEVSNDTYCNLKLNNVIGQVVMNKFYSELSKGKRLYKWDISLLSKGVYYLDIETSSVKITRKVIVF